VSNKVQRKENGMRNLTGPRCNEDMPIGGVGLKLTVKKLIFKFIKRIEKLLYIFIGKAIFLLRCVNPAAHYIPPVIKVLLDLPSPEG